MTEYCVVGKLHIRIDSRAKAICHASGVRIKRLPFTPDKVQKALETKTQGKES